MLQDPSDTLLTSLVFPAQPLLGARVPEPPRKKARPDGPLRLRAVRMLKDVDFAQTVAEGWTRALSKWQAIFEVIGFQGPVGAMLQNDSSHARELLTDVFGTKSYRSCEKWCQESQLSCWPPDAKLVLQYMAASEEAGKSKLTGK